MKPNVFLEQLEAGNVVYTNTFEFTDSAALEEYRKQLFAVAEELYGAFACENDGSVSIVRAPEDPKDTFRRYTFTY